MQINVSFLFAFRHVSRNEIWFVNATIISGIDLMPVKFVQSNSLLSTAIFVFLVFGGCSAAATKTQTNEQPQVIRANNNVAANYSAIKIEPNSPADTVRAFYKNLREKHIREAIFLTNLRPAIEGLTENELKEFSMDFEALAANVPSEIEINGEIISGDLATVTAKLPDENLEKTELQEIKLRKENGVWIILTVDEDSEKLIKQEGKNYFYTLRIETHQDEAKAMLDRISKGQLAYASQHNGNFGDLKALIESGFVPPDVQSPESTGYIYTVTLTDNKTKYFSTATPAVYGKSGRLSFLVVLNERSTPVLTSEDNKGKPMKK